MGGQVKLPVTRGDCKDGPRPCPFACRYRLDGAESCALDVADRGEQLNPEAVALLMGMSQAGVRWVEDAALAKVRPAFDAPVAPPKPPPKPLSERMQARVDRRLQLTDERYRTVLADGPLVAADIAARVGGSPRRALPQLERMRVAGELTTTMTRRRGKPTRLWALVPRAEAAE